MGKIGFTESAWKDYLYWQSHDKKKVKKINDLIKDISRNGALNGEGKPELLKLNLSGYYSRHIDEYNRLVYSISESEDAEIEIQQCRGHYGDK